MNKKISLSDFQEQANKNVHTNNGLSTIEWKEHKTNKMFCNPELVYFYVKKKKLKLGGVSNHCTIGIGIKLADLCKFDVKTKVKIYSAPNNPYWIRIVKSTDEYGYTIGFSRIFRSLRKFTTVFNNLDLIETAHSLEVPFDFLEDDSLVIDLEKLKDTSPKKQEENIITASPYFRGIKSAKLTHSG